MDSESILSCPRDVVGHRSGNAPIQAPSHVPSLPAASCETLCDHLSTDEGRIPCPRESCHPYEGNYVKDLMCLGRPLSDTIIVDNSPHSYVFQVTSIAFLKAIR